MSGDLAAPASILRGDTEPESTSTYRTEPASTTRNRLSDAVPQSLLQWCFPTHSPTRRPNLISSLRQQHSRPLCPARIPTSRLVLTGCLCRCPRLTTGSTYNMNVDSPTCGRPGWAKGWGMAHPITTTVSHPFVIRRSTRRTPVQWPCVLYRSPPSPPPSGCKPGRRRSTQPPTGVYTPLYRPNHGTNAGTTGELETARRAVYTGAKRHGDGEPPLTDPSEPPCDHPYVTGPTPASRTGPPASNTPPGTSRTTHRASRSSSRP